MQMLREAADLTGGSRTFFFFLTQLWSDFLAAVVLFELLGVGVHLSSGSKRGESYAWKC